MDGLTRDDIRDIVREKIAAAKKAEKRAEVDAIVREWGLAEWAYQAVMRNFD